MENNKKSIWGWAFYDWANSAFATTVMAGFFPVFFKQYWSAGADVNVSTAKLGMANSLASLAVALMAPILGAIADRGRAKKKFLIFFAYFGVLMTACLFLVGKGSWLPAVVLFALASVGFAGANVFYDALLPAVAGEASIDVVSGFGYAMGYLGGGLLFLLNVLMALRPGWFGFASGPEAVRYCFLSVAVWWGGFTVLTILWVREGDSRTAALKRGNIVAQGFRQFTATFKKVRYLKTVFLFLGAYWFYIDGVDTVIRMAVDYGMSLGFDSRDLIVALLITQFVGFPSALAFGKLGERWSVKKSLFLAIGVYMLVTVWGVLMNDKVEFYILAGTIGLVQGGIQALSRSYYSRLIPREQAGEFFGFYNMLGKCAAILGPALMGGVGLLAKRVLMPPSPSPDQIEAAGRLAARTGIGSILVLFIAGAVLLYFVDEKKGREDAARLET